MIARLLTVALTIGFATAAVAAEPENPFKNAQVGDFVVYKATMSFGGMKQESKIKMLVSGKDDRNVTLRTIVEMNGMQKPASETKVDLSKPYDPLALTPGINVKDIKVEKLGAGKEKIQAAGKDYDAEWERSKVTMKLGDRDFVTEVKAWKSKTVPLGGSVRMEMKSELFNMTMELIDSGREK
jgi:hypothetical protein